MLWATNTLNNGKGDAFSGLAFLIPPAAAFHTMTDLLPAAFLSLADLS